ncbi:MULTISPECIES: DUF349 domain-containing protein [unclassified Flavobacterium]|uniref:DUF349 domain-containing protein n=1 Tax=unclassified Flavobacterium TaxID=196869 RepID=UPI0012915117|nr:MULTISPECIES: DUF349 domain-containing protein [unclassified Flavobacterium]MQP52931.1 DUF349 domain-containing protein [Flavobacterium sp. LMO9]MQP63180.1 DUF349 domain-containing protein [Flavobacterium sp. LMO6]
MSEAQHDNLQNADGQEQIDQTENVTLISQSVLDEIDNSNAEENEDDSIKEKHEIPVLDYDVLSMEELTDELEKLVENEKVMAIKDHVEGIRKAFSDKYHHFIEEKKEEFSAQNNEEGLDSEYHFPLKNKFDGIYNSYKSSKAKHFKQLQNNLEQNFATREGLIEELKNLIDSGDSSIGDMFKKVNDIRDRWKNAGAIPRDKYNILWNNYHFHIERFYDIMHLDKEARDLDLKNNLEQKQHIITKAKELLTEEDVLKAFRELQLLHRIWKEEIGPVDREHREVIWNEFSEITKQMHDKREGLYAIAREKETETLAIKNEIIRQIEALGTEKIDAHSGWQTQIKKMEALREAFFKAGKVPAEVTEETWAKFKNAVRAFNAHKNVFYKDIKNEQHENLTKKLELVEKAKSLKESSDFAATTPIMKKIQDDWKKIGHVPRKYSDSIWKEFKEACNAYFDRMHEAKNAETGEEVEAFEKKKAFLEELKDFTLSGEHKTDLESIKSHIATWKTFGKVPFNRRHIEGKFNKILDALFEKLSLSKKDTEMMRFNNRLEQMSDNDDKRALEQEQYFIRKKIDEVQGEIFQLENNIQFISSSSKGENPFIKEVQKSIERHKDDLKLWKEKLQQIKKM